MASLDMSLDDMIKNNRKNNQRGRGGGPGQARRGRGGPGGLFRGGRRITGPSQRGPLGVNARQSPFAIAKSIRRRKNVPWQNGLLEDGLKAAGLSVLESGTKLYVTNLDAGVSNEDIRELFSEIGELMRYAIHYDKNGRASGSAEVVFARRSDAFQAVRRYNNVQLDGRPMKIELVGAKAEVPVAARMNVIGGANGRRTVLMPPGPGRMRNLAAAAAAANQGIGRVIRGDHSGRGRGIGRGRGGGGRGGRGRGRGRGNPGREKAVEKSAEDLDKELENYHSEAMQT